MSFEPRREEVLSLMLEEVWDLTEAIQELERRRDKLRDTILRSCRDSKVDRYLHAGGALRIDRYRTFEIKEPSRVLSLLDQRGWVDDVLSVKGRALFKQAEKEPATLAYLRLYHREIEKEILVLSPRRIPKMRA